MNDDSPNIRQRLLQAASQVFAEKGYAEASTREICRLAEANAAAIHYHFGDKASLYRAVCRPPDFVIGVPPALLDPETTLRAGLEAFFAPLVPLLTESCIPPHLHMLLVREQVQPSGLLNESCVDFFRPQHEQFCRFLARHCDLAEPDEAVQHLAVSITGMAMMLFIKRDFVEAMAPHLLRDDGLEATLARLADYAVNLVEAEARRRRGEP